MRRLWRVSVLAALLLLAWSSSTVGQSDAQAIESDQGSLGGQLRVVVPEEAAPPDMSITVVTRDPSERPEELDGVPMSMAFYELQPSDVRFSAPVTVERSIGFGELGLDHFDPVFDGLVAGSLFTRDADGTWSWLDDVEVRLDAAGAAFVLKGMTDHSGPIIGYVAGDVIVATEDAAPSAVGEVFRVEGKLRVDPASQADITSVSGRTADKSIAQPVRSYVVEFFDRAGGLEFECIAAGTVPYEATFVVSGVADIGPLSSAIGLTPTDVAVTYAGQHTCE